MIINIALFFVLLLKSLICIHLITVEHKYLCQGCTAVPLNIVVITEIKSCQPLK